jgi:hypothetical protein
VKKWRLPLLLILLLAIPLALLLRPLVRDVLVVELLRFWASIQFLYQSLPQLPIWLAFLAFSLLFALLSLTRGRWRFQAKDEPLARREGQVQTLARWIHQAGQSEYYKWRLTQHLDKLAWQVMAYREGTTPQELKDRLWAGRLDLPPAVLTYLQVHNKGRIAEPAGLLSRLDRRLRFRDVGQPFDPALEEVVRFLEDQLEVNRDHS